MFYPNNELPLVPYLIFRLRIFSLSVPNLHRGGEDEVGM